MKIKTMKTFILAVAVYLGVGWLAACASGSKPAEKPAGTNVPIAVGKMTVSTNVLSNEKERVSYAIGMKMGHDFQLQGIEVNPDTLVRGIKDVQSGGATLITPQEMRTTLTEYQKVIAAKMRQMREAAAAKNKAEGEAFLAGNKTKPGIVTLPDGLQYKAISDGAGTVPMPTDTVSVNYRGTLIDGTEFDSSARAGHPAQFPVNGVIPGWTEALTKMKAGSKWQLFIPPNLAYGESGRPGIPPDSVLIFEVELLSVEHSKPTEPLTSDIIKVPSLDEMKKGAKIEVIKPEDVGKVQAAGTNKPSK